MLGGSQTKKKFGDHDNKSKGRTRNRALKITAVGDGMVGKTCLLITYTNKVFPLEYVPTVFDNFSGTISVDNQVFDITLWDTAGQEDYERLRPMSYPNTDCFVLCYSISSRPSYENIFSKWYPEIRHHCPRVPIILVATKADLRDTPAPQDSPSDNTSLHARSTSSLSRLTHITRPAGSATNAKKVELVSTRAGKKMKRRIGAAKYLECSAIRNEGLDDVFVAAVRSAVKGKEKSCCCTVQ